MSNNTAILLMVAAVLIFIIHLLIPNNVGYSIFTEWSISIIFCASVGIIFGEASEEPKPLYL
jgi:amino acid transporter